ncbi:hypothetical protein C2E23DRAFT_352158 [Lenzites betulinus]|nr:hypothetical protein C2E23DRAFT_352158 [Lenzites betulinus]
MAAQGQQQCRCASGHGGLADQALAHMVVGVADVTPGPCNIARPGSVARRAHRGLRARALCSHSAPRGECDREGPSVTRTATCLSGAAADWLAVMSPCAGSAEVPRTEGVPSCHSRNTTVAITSECIARGASAAAGAALGWMRLGVRARILNVLTVLEAGGVSIWKRVQMDARLCTHSCHTFSRFRWGVEARDMYILARCRAHGGLAVSAALQGVCPEHRAGGPTDARTV